MNEGNAKFAWFMFWLGATSPLWGTLICMLFIGDQENGTLLPTYFCILIVAFVAITGRGIYLLPRPKKEKTTWWIIALMLWGISFAAVFMFFVSQGDLGR